VLHADEITYAIVAPVDVGPLAGGISSSYRRIALGLQEGLSRLGVEVGVERIGTAPAPGTKGPCFSARTRYELSTQGRKLVGSAQRRTDQRLLQHGSLLLGAPSPRLWSALGAGHEEALAASVGLEELMMRPSQRSLVACLSRGIADVLGLPRRYGRLTARERRSAQRLTSKYRDGGWTRRR
jgi:lipoate-protein ligase A